MPCAGPKSGMSGKYLGHTLKNKAAEASKSALKENPAFSWVKMQAKKSPVLPKHKKDTEKGKASNLPRAFGKTEMADQGLE